jgi:hypothetical protein
MASKTALLVFCVALKFLSSERILDTHAADTPALFATSRIVANFPPFQLPGLLTNFKIWLIPGLTAEKPPIPLFPPNSRHFPETEVLSLCLVNFYIKFTVKISQSQFHVSESIYQTQGRARIKTFTI